MTTKKLVFRPGSIVLNCGDGTAQFGLDSRWALRLGGLANHEIEWLQDAAHRAKPPAAIAASHQVAYERAAAISATLKHAELLLTNPTPPKSKPVISNEIATLNSAAELPALSALRPDGDGHQTLLTRAQRTVAISSGCRIGAGLALLLATAGVGRVIILDDGPVLDTDLGPYRACHLGLPRRNAIAQLVAEVAPAVQVTADGTSDVVVSVEFGTQTSAYFGPLLSLATPHLPIATQEASAEVGPFMLPNQTACAHCLQLTRSSVDASWAGLVSEIARHAAIGVEATVACATIGLAAGQVLSYIAGVRPALLNQLATISAPDLLPRLTEVPPHPDCGCVLMG